MTEQQFNQWLTTPNAVRVLLIELEHSSGTAYIANIAYLGEPVSRDNQHRQYEPVLIEAVDISDRLDGELTIGDISVINDGLLSDWLTYQWAEYSVRGYLGDPTWPRQAFYQVLNVTNAGLQSAENGQITLAVHDARAQLDTPLITETINGSGAPVAFGQIFNAPAVLINRATNLYKVSALPLAQLNAADRGNFALQETIDLVQGEFIAAATPQGVVTANVTGIAITAADIARQIAQIYNVAVDEQSLHALPDWELGAFYSDGTQTTGRQVLDDICLSIGAYWRMDGLNRLHLANLRLPTTSSHHLSSDDVERNTLQLSSVQAPYSQISVRYAKNYSPLQVNALASASVIGIDLHTKLQDEWKTHTVSPTLTGYPLADKQQFDTQLADQTGATQRANTIKNIRQSQRYVWQLTAFASALLLKPGDSVFLKHDDWPEFSAGKWVLVLANHRDLTGETCDLEIWY